MWNYFPLIGSYCWHISWALNYWMKWKLKWHTLAHAHIHHPSQHNAQQKLRIDKTRSQPSCTVYILLLHCIWFDTIAILFKRFHNAFIYLLLRHISSISLSLSDLPLQSLSLPLFINKMVAHNRNDLILSSSHFS